MRFVLFAQIYVKQIRRNVCVNRVYSTHLSELIVWPGKGGSQSRCLRDCSQIWTQIQALLSSASPSPHSTTLFPSRCSSSPHRSVFRASVSSLSVVGCGLCRVRIDRALLAAKPAERETERMLNWLVWLYIYSAISQAKHMGRSGAASRCIKTTFWECVRVEGWFPVRVSAEPCVELWRHRWRDASWRNRGPAEKKCTAFACFPLWTYVCWTLACDRKSSWRKGKKKKQTFADELAGQTGIILKDREFGFKVCWIWTPGAAPGDLLWHGSSQFLDTETGFLSVTRTSQ